MHTCIHYFREINWWDKISKLCVVSVMINADEYDAYIIVSFTNATLVLSIGETVEEITNSGFLGTTPTLAAHQLGEDALLQVYALYDWDHVILVLCV